MNSRRHGDKSPEPEPRTAGCAILDTTHPHGTAWLGEDSSTPEAAKAVLTTMEGVNWQAAVEPKKPRTRKP